MSVLEEDLVVDFRGTRPMLTYYVGVWKVTIDPEEGSSSCECPDHTAWVLDPVGQPRCAHSGAAWREFHKGGILG
jgi:hypothetical protein